MMMHINGPERKDISLRCCMTGTDEMFDYVRETKKEMEEKKGRMEGKREEEVVGGGKGKEFDFDLSYYQQ